MKIVYGIQLPGLTQCPVELIPVPCDGGMEKCKILMLK